jgi:hypothetical protein
MLAKSWRWRSACAQADRVAKVQFYRGELHAVLLIGWQDIDLVLVELTEPLFICATTVCRLSGPKEYLNKVLQYRKSTFSQTYLPVLD